MSTIKCTDCGDLFEGTRYEARRAHWEPWSYSSQHALDHGPMVCSPCVGRLLDDVLGVMKRAMRAGRY